MRNGEMGKKASIFYCFDHIIPWIRLKEMMDGKMAPLYSGCLWRHVFFDSEKISVNICASSQFIKKSSLQGLLIKETFSSVSIKHVCHNAFAVMLKK